MAAPAATIFDDSDYAAIGMALGMSTNDVKLFLRDQQAMHSFRVDQLKQIIKYLRTKLRLSIPLSGNKLWLIERIAKFIYLSGVPTMSQAPPPPSARYSAPLPPLASILPETLRTPTSTKFVLDEASFNEHQDPYYQQKQILLITPFGPSNTAIRDPNYWYRCQFDLPPEILAQLRPIRSTATIAVPQNAEQYQVHLRFYTREGDMRPTYENQLKINQKTPELTGVRAYVAHILLVATPSHTYIEQNYKKIRVPKGQFPFTTPKPTDITPFVSHRTMIEFRVPRLLSGALVVQLVQLLDTDQLVAEIVNNSSRHVDAKAVLLQAQSKAATDDIQEVSVGVSLRCPLSFKRIETPSRGTNCAHLQCFDLRTYLEYSHQQQAWHCPRCNKKTPYHELIIDEFFLGILRDTPSDASTVDIDIQTGKFSVRTQTEDPTPIRRSTSAAHTMVVTLDDEEGDNRTQQSHIAPPSNTSPPQIGLSLSMLPVALTPPDTNGRNDGIAEDAYDSASESPLMSDEEPPRTEPGGSYDDAIVLSD